MSGRIQEWLRQKEPFLSHGSAWRSQRRPSDIYSICSASGKPLRHIAAVQNLESLSGGHDCMAFSSSDSSVIPFAESKAASAQDLELGNYLRKDGVHVEVSTPQTSKRDTYLQMDGRRTKDFKRKPRHKMRVPREDQPAEVSNEVKGGKSGRKEGIKVSLKDGRRVGALADEFSGDNLTRERLTLRPSHRLGIFKKGRASTSTKKGLPDLAFSEMKFLDGKFPHITMTKSITPKREKGHESQGLGPENGISVYFDSSKRRLRENKSDTITTPNSTYSKPKKRPRQGFRDLPEEMPPEIFVATSQIRSSSSSVITEIHCRKCVHLSSTNRSSPEPHRDTDVVQANVAEESSKDIDERSEYSRSGFQIRFKADARGSAHLHKKERHGGEACPSTGISIVEPPEPRGRGCSGKLQLRGKCATTVVGVKDMKVNAELTLERVSDTPKLVTAAEKSQALDNRCTPEPSEIQKVLGSSSPLAALLRVCADSPISLTHTDIDRERHDTSVPLGKLQKQDIDCDNGWQYQPQRDLGQPSEKMFGFVDTPKARALIRSKGIERKQNNHRRKSGDWRVLPKTIGAKSEERPPHSGKQQEASRGLEPRDQIIRSHSSVEIADSQPYNYVLYNQQLDQRSHIMCEGEILEFEAECLDEARQERSYEALHKAPEYITDGGGQLKFAGDSFIGSSEYTPTILSEDLFSNDMNDEFDEGKITKNFGRSCAAIAQYQAMDTGQYLIEDHRYGDIENQLELELETNHPRLRRVNFWRRHKLG